MNDRTLNAQARRECEAVNEAGRAEARRSGNYDERAWLHPDEWVRMRSALLLIVGVMRLDGAIAEAENDALESWVNRWIERSHWGDCYLESKGKALNVLVRLLDPTSEEMVEAAEHCSRKLSTAQQLALADHLDQLIEAGSVEHRSAVYRLREIMLIGI